MDFSEVIGQNHIKSHLKTTVENGRVPHAQLFVGAAGSGVLPTAIAYAKLLLCNKYDPASTEYNNCAQKVDKLSHPDLHFVFPVNKTDRVKKHPVSSNFLEEWRAFVKKNSYASLFEWLQQLGIEKKQGNISVDEAGEMMKNLSLKSYEGGFKIMIVWMAEKMNGACANKILKIVEEPPEKTILLLLTEKEEQILTTIRSRCQRLHFPALSEKDIAAQLEKTTDSNTAKKIAHRASGDYNSALKILAADSDDTQFEKWFLSWVRTAFLARGNKQAVRQLLDWSDSLAGEGRETQKKFLHYCIEIFRQALLKNYQGDAMVYFEAEDKGFTIEKFAPFIHQNNIFQIVNNLETAIYHIERNGNAKVIFSDLSIQLTRLIHAKENA